MESKDILKILENFEKDNTYKKIFINGKWGIGKSFYTNKYISEKENIIYLSLFGKEKLEAIEQEIVKELLKRVNSRNKLWIKGKQLAKKVGGSISFHGISINSPEVKSKSFIEEYGSILDEKENLVIVFDDLERKSGKIEIEDILGIIEQLSLCAKTKIVLIGDEGKINLNDTKMWNSFKEKIIEKEYKITRFSEEAINSLIISKLRGYISEEDLNSFIGDFFKKFTIDNLRTINKGVNLFLDIVNTYLKGNCSEINRILLQVCMAVAIETTENLFKPKEKDKDEMYEYYKDFERSLDEDMTTRIERHYFNSYFFMNKEAFLVHYVLDIFNGNFTKSLIDEMNQSIENLLNTVEEKNIFYLSENDIKQIVCGKYNSIINNEYSYIGLDEFIDDIYNILDWYKVLEIEYDKKQLGEMFKGILLSNYYKSDKNLYENTIDRFMLKYDKCPELKEYIDDYNYVAEEKYYIKKIKDIEKSFREKEFDVNKLRWMDSAFIQSNKEVQFERFINFARKNNYFISNISGEICEEEWRWIHYIWHIFHNYMSQKYKDELNKYANNLKGKNKVQDLRINALQESNPLVNEDNKKNE